MTIFTNNLISNLKLRTIFLSLIFLACTATTAFAATYYSDPTSATVVFTTNAVGGTVTSTGWSTDATGVTKPFGTVTILTTDNIVIQAGRPVTSAAGISQTIGNVTFSGGTFILASSTFNSQGDVTGTGVYNNATGNTSRITMIGGTNKKLNVTLTGTGGFTIGSSSVSTNTISLGGNCSFGGRMSVGGSATTANTLDLNGFNLTADNVYVQALSKIKCSGVETINITGVTTGTVSSTNTSQFYFDQFTPGTTNALAGVIINHAAGVKLFTEATINALTLTKGNMVLAANYNLTVGTILGGSSTSFICTDNKLNTVTGSLICPVGAGVKQFIPMGTITASSTSTIGNTYDPVSLTPANATTFTVHVKNALTDSNALADRLSLVFREWNIASSSPSSTDIELTPNYPVVSANPVMGHYMNGVWEEITATRSSNTWTATTTKFSPFAVGEKGSFSAPIPKLFGTATTAAFTSSYGSPSAAQSFAVSGKLLSADMIATAPAGYQISTNGTIYSNTVTFAQSAGTAGGTLYLRLSDTTSVGTYNSSAVVLSSTGVTSINITTPSTGNTVSPKALTAASTVATKIYDGTTTPGAVTLGTVTGLANNQTLNITATASAYTNANAGTKNTTITYTLASGTGSVGNYTMAALPVTAIISPKALTAPSTINAKAYDGTAIAGTVSIGTLNGVMANEALTITAAATDYASANVGSYAANIVYTLNNGTGGLATNYTMANLATTGAITKLNISIVVTAGQGKAMGTDDPPAFNFTVSPALKLSDMFTGAITRVAGDVQGKYAYLLGTLNAGTNYNLSIAAIDSFAVVVVSSPTLYGGTTTAAFSTTYGTPSGAQKYYVSGVSLSAPIVVTAPMGYQVSINDTLYSSSISLAKNSLNAAKGNVFIRLADTAAVMGVYDAKQIVLSSTGATSITITTPSTGNMVKAKALTLTGISANNKVYDGTIFATLGGTPVYVGLKTGQSFAVAGTPVASFKTAVADTNKTVTVTGYRAPNTNYLLDTSLTLKANITPSPLTITGVTANNKWFDNTTAAFVSGMPVYIGLKSKDSFAVVGTPTAQFISAAVGKNIAVTVNGFNAPSANYSVSQPTGLTANIKASIDWTGFIPRRIIVTLLSGQPSIKADALMVIYDSLSTNAINADDSLKMKKVGENLSIVNAEQLLMIENRSSVAPADTLQLKLTGVSIKSYQLKLQLDSMDAGGLSAFLMDNYLKTSIALKPNSTTYVSFDITSMAGSYASNRFAIIYKMQEASPVSFLNLSTNRKDIDVELAWKVANENGITQYEVQRSTDNLNYTSIGSLNALGNAAASWSYTYVDMNTPTTALYYRVKANTIKGGVQYSNFIQIKAATDSTINPISVFPNPVQGGSINIHFNQQAAGTYSVRLLNYAGYGIATSTISHAGGNSLHVFTLPSGLPRGYYKLELIAPDNLRSVQTVFFTGQ